MLSGNMHDNIRCSWPPSYPVITEGQQVVTGAVAAIHNTCLTLKHASWIQ